MRNKVPLIVGAVLVGVCGFGGYTMMQMRGAKPPEVVPTAKVTRGKFQLKVVETGSVDAIRSVDVKSRASGRLAKLLVDEGTFVRKGQLIAIIDPQETELQLAQNRAQLRGAMSGVQRTGIEIEQRRITAKASYDAARARLDQVARELRLQPTLTKAAITQAATDLNGLREERRRLVENSQPNARTTAESAVREAEANLGNATRDYDRLNALLEKGYVAGREVDDAKLQLDLAKVRLQSARDQYNRLESQLRAELAKTDEQIRQAESALNRAKVNSVQDMIKSDEYRSAVTEVDKARAALRDVDVLTKQKDESQAAVDRLSSVLGDSERQLRETRIVAPIDGIVAKKLIEEGELVSGLSSFSQGTSVVRIEDRSSMRVMLDVNEIDVARLRLGMPSTVEVDAIPGKTFAGNVIKVAPASVNTGNAAATSTSSDVVVRYEVEIRINGSDPQLRSGMSAKCAMNVVDRNGVLQLPAEFVGQDGDQRYVEIPLDKDAKPGAVPERKNIVVGATTGSIIEVLSGVSEGTVVQRPQFTGPPRKGVMGGGNPNQQEEEKKK